MKAFFDKNRQYQELLDKKIKKFRHSVDAPELSRPKMSLEQKEIIKREICLCNEKSKKCNHFAYPSKLQATMTAKTSLNATKANSPLKDSTRLINHVAELSLPAKRFKFFYQIGLGAFGKVWKVQQRASGKEFALKELLKSTVIERHNLTSVITQKKILSQLKNGFLVNLHRSFQDQTKLYLLMDYLRGADLRYHICYVKRFSEDQIKFIAACILIALEYVHSKRIIHKAIKPQNMIFQENGYLRLTDFGIAVRKATSQGIESSGTPVYMAPQILFKRNYSYQSDFYSLGIVIFELVMGKRPYSGKTRNQIREQLSNKEICLSDFQLPESYSSYLADLLNKLLKKNPSQRLGKKGVKEIKQHPFFESVKWKRMQRKEVKPPYVPNVVCETQAYLSEISLFNEMNPGSVAGNQQQSKYDFIENYEFVREINKKKGIKKVGRNSKSKFLP